MSAIDPNSPPTLINPGTSGGGSVTPEQIADLSGVFGADNSFHLIEPSGPFLDQGSAPATLVETGTFRRARLGPRALIPGVWAPDPAGRACLTFDPVTSSATWTIGVTVRANGEGVTGGSLLFLFGAVNQWARLIVDATTINGQVNRGGSIDGGPTPAAVDWNATNRLVFRCTAGGSPQTFLNGVHQTGCDFAWPPLNPVVRVGLFGMNEPLTDPLAVRGLSANDLNYWTRDLSDDEITEDFERYASSFRF